MVYFKDSPVDEKRFYHFHFGDEDEVERRSDEQKRFWSWLGKKFKNYFGDQDELERRTWALNYDLANLHAPSAYSASQRSIIAKAANSLAQQYTKIAATYGDETE